MNNLLSKVVKMFVAALLVFQRFCLESFQRKMPVCHRIRARQMYNRGYNRGCLRRIYAAGFFQMMQGQRECRRIFPNDEGWNSPDMSGMMKDGSGMTQGPNGMQQGDMEEKERNDGERSFSNEKQTSRMQNL